MTTFLRLLAEDDKASALAAVCARLRQGEADPRVFEVEPTAFDAVPGKPFAYWVSDAVRQTFQRLPRFESEGRTVKQGLATADDFRFVRAWWEVSRQRAEGRGQRAEGRGQWSEVVPLRQGRGLFALLCRCVSHGELGKWGGGDQSVDLSPLPLFERQP